jgi:hypothetical protein
MQELHGKYYSLKNGAYNAMSIVKVEQWVVRRPHPALRATFSWRRREMEASPSFFQPFKN